MAIQPTISLKQSKRSRQQVETMYDTTYSAGLGGAVKRIRTPHKHDVLSGRGGGINGHEGNIRFREWVSLRKNEYNLANSKSEKAEIAHEVIALVRGQNPPGRFLQRDPTSSSGSGWWVEIDDERIMAKTSQALREGAPQIRAAHKDEITGQTRKGGPWRRSKPVQNLSSDNHPEPEVPMSMSNKTALLINQLKANADAAKRSNEVDTPSRPAKRVRVEFMGHTLLPSDATPPLLPMQAPTDPSLEDENPRPLDEFPVLPGPPQPGLRLLRTHSLALSDISSGDLPSEDFVNPFDDETEQEAFQELFPLSPRPGLLRETSTASDMGGLGALFRSDPMRNSANSTLSGNFGVRSSFSSSISRYDDGGLGHLTGEESSSVISPLDQWWWDVDTLPRPVSP